MDSDELAADDATVDQSTASRAAGCWQLKC